MSDEEISFRDIFESFNRIARQYAPEFLVGDNAPKVNEPQPNPRREPGHSEEVSPEQMDALREEAARKVASEAQNEEPARDIPPPATGPMTVERARRVLGVADNATHTEIRNAYRKLIIRYHPDRNGHLPVEEQERARRRAVELNMAYALLKDHPPAP